MNHLNIHFSSALANRAGRDRSASPEGATFNWFHYRVNVAFRPWDDLYTVFCKATGEHLVTFMDTGSGIEVVTIADGYELTSHYGTQPAVALVAA